jgi:hypothetical protein
MQTNSANSAKIIQAFYRKYIKTQRDPVTHYPLDPIGRDGIPPERRVKIIHASAVQYFDINTLHLWFSTCKAPLNPMTNMDFTPKQLAQIVQCYHHNNKHIPYFIQCVAEAAAIVTPSSKAAAAAATTVKNKKTKNTPPTKKVTGGGASAPLPLPLPLPPPNTVTSRKIILATVPDGTGTETLCSLLCENAIEIQLGVLNLNYNTPLPPKCVQKAVEHQLPPDMCATALMCAVLHDNIAAVKELLYFNQNINAREDRYDLTALDIVIRSQQPNNLEILKWLLFYGADLHSCYDAITNVEMLSYIHSLSSQ